MKSAIAGSQKIETNICVLTFLYLDYLLFFEIHSNLPLSIPILSFYLKRIFFLLQNQISLVVELEVKARLVLPTMSCFASLIIIRLEKTHYGNGLREKSLNCYINVSDLWSTW